MPSPRPSTRLCEVGISQRGPFCACCVAAKLPTSHVEGICTNLFSECRNEAFFIKRFRSRPVVEVKHVQTEAARVCARACHTSQERAAVDAS